MPDHAAGCPVQPRVSERYARRCVAGARGGGVVPTSSVVRVQTDVAIQLRLFQAKSIREYATEFMVSDTICRVRLCRASIDWSVLVMIGASLGLGSALEVSGTARAIEY